MGKTPQGFYPMKFREVNPAMKGSFPPGVWRPFQPGSADRPQPGDFVITVNPASGYFQHVSVMRSQGPGLKGTEGWTTVDGGGLQAVKLTKYFDPASGELKNKNQVHYGWKSNYRVSGWIDAAKLADAGM